MNSALPPRYINIPAREAYHSDLSDGLFRTLVQIRGLAYRVRGERTPPLTLKDLAALRGVSRRTILNHLAALRARDIIRTEPVGEHTFVIHLLSGQPGQAAQAEGEATPAGDRGDGPAATAARHHAAKFPLRWGSGAALPVLERADAVQAEQEDLLRPGLNGSGAHGMKPAGGYDGAACRPAGSPPSPGPPRLKKRRRGRQARRGCAKNGAVSAKNGAVSAKNSTPSAKNGTRFTHVVVKDHDSNKEDHEQQHEHDRALLKNESGLDGVLQDLAGVLAGQGMPPGDAQRKARWLLEKFGADVCARQRQVFERRCELARASQQGLRNPVGLLCASIRGDWSLPAAENERKETRWFTDEEFEAFFEH